MSAENDSERAVLRIVEFYGKNVEIQQFNWLLHITAFFMLTLMVVVIAVAKLTTFEDAMLFVPILGLGWSWAMARYDYLMHRVGAFLAREYRSAWEISPERNHKLWVIALTDGFAIIPFATLVGYAEWTLWTEQGMQVYVIITTAAFLAGVGMIAYAGTMFRKDKVKEAQ
jgi:hypothetical protein